MYVNDILICNKKYFTPRECKLLAHLLNTQMREKNVFLKNNYSRVQSLFRTVNNPKHMSSRP